MAVIKARKVLGCDHELSWMKVGYDSGYTCALESGRSWSSYSTPLFISKTEIIITSSICHVSEVR